MCFDPSSSWHSRECRFPETREQEPPEFGHRSPLLSLGWIPMANSLYSWTPAIVLDLCTYCVPTAYAQRREGILGINWAPQDLFLAPLRIRRRPPTIIRSRRAELNGLWELHCTHSWGRRALLSLDWNELRVYAQKSLNTDSATGKWKSFKKVCL